MLDDIALPGIGGAVDRHDRPDRIAAAVDAFWRHHERCGEPLRTAVAQLADAALAQDPARAAEGTRVLFERIVEPLCDGFTEAGASCYRRAFAQIIGEARQRRQCDMLHRMLADDGIFSESDLLTARTAGAPVRLDVRTRDKVRRVVVLSRLTLGADVAVTSVLLARVAEVFPNARICCVGTRSAQVLTQNLPEVDFFEVPYRRSDYLAERLNAWPALRETVRSTCGGAAPNRYVVIDPDSRLTQLGLLPPVDRSRYYHFPSRSFAGADAAPLSVLAARWLDETFGPGPDVRPTLQMPQADADWSRALRAAIRGEGPLVSISFGVGGNERKRAGAGFETELIAWLIRRGCRVLLARGVGHAEVEQAYSVGRSLEHRGVPVRHLPRGRSLSELTGQRPRLVTWEADVGAFIAAVACADAYVGYDSAGQHIAAALGVPTLSLFIESAGARHAERWAPTGTGPVRVVRSASPADPDALLKAAGGALDALLPCAAEGQVSRPPGDRDALLS